MIFCLYLRTGTTVQETKQSWNLVNSLPKLKAETTSHYLLRCHLFSEQKTKLLENLKNLDNALLSHCDDELLQILLYGSHKFSFSVNNKILSLTIKFLESAKRFDKPLP